jgi:hypothetical protein
VLVVNQSCEISTVIKNEVEGLAIFESNELLLQTPFVFFLCLAFPGKDRGAAGSNGSCCMILCRENVT